jgi:A/G-specific adenine glycosylase
MTSKNILWFRRRLRDWARTNLRDFPWRRTRDPYAIFLAESLLQKTTAEAVVPIYNAVLYRYPTVDRLAAANLDDLNRLLEPLGLFFRASRLLDAAQIVCRDYGGIFPKTEAKLLQLPGAGKYTARSLLANAFSKSAAVLDTNVARIFERFFGVRGERVKSRCKLLWGLADDIVPRRDASGWNLTLLDFGALVCTARQPKCQSCPLARRCVYRQSTQTNPEPLPHSRYPED